MFYCIFTSWPLNAGGLMWACFPSSTLTEAFQGHFWASFFPRPFLTQSEGSGVQTRLKRAHLVSIWQYTLHCKPYWFTSLSPQYLGNPPCVLSNHLWELECQCSHAVLVLQPTPLMVTKDAILCCNYTYTLTKLYSVRTLKSLSLRQCE